jgi:hypothetical protein
VLVLEKLYKIEKASVTKRKHERSFELSSFFSLVPLTLLLVEGAHIARAIHIHTAMAFSALVYALFVNTALSLVWIFMSQRSIEFAQQEALTARAPAPEPAAAGYPYPQKRGAAAPAKDGEFLYFRLP